MNDVSEDNKEQNENTGSNWWTQWSYGMAILVLGIWLWKYQLPDWFPEYFEPFSCEARAADIESEIENRLRWGRMYAAYAGRRPVEDFEISNIRNLTEDAVDVRGLGDLVFDGTRGEAKREKDFDEMFGNKIRCTLTWTVFNPEENKVEREDVRYTVLKRADGKGYITKREE